MIKTIAVDMDGTFLNSSNDYNREEFLELFNKLKNKGVNFVVASGNQYAQISSFFPEIWREITSYGVDIILCGVESAYILKTGTDEFKDNAAKYYFELKEIDSFQQLPDDEWVKIALHLDDKNAFSLIEMMNSNNDSKLKAVYSGHESVDLIANNINKGNTLSQLLNQWEIKPEQLLAFGDSNNDLEMLELAGYSYSMGNAGEQATLVAKYQAPSNDENGVISTINSLIDELG